MTTWEDVHVGDIVVGHDGLLYGVARVAFTVHGPAVTIRRNGVEISAQPPRGTPIEIWKQRPEVEALQMLADAGLAPEVIREMNG